MLSLVTSSLFGFPAPLGIVLLGLVIGSVMAFISMGIVLIYRTNRIINFAGADIGAVAAVFSVMLLTEAHLNYFAAVAIGIALGLLLGGLIEVSVIRRFFKAPRMILTVVTIALTQLLLFFQVIIPLAFDVEFVSASVPTPFGFSFPIRDPRGQSASVIFDGNHLLSVLAVPLVAAGLGAFLKFTSIGTAARGVADNAERASLLGIPVKRVSTVVWIVAGGMSALGSLLRAPTVGLSITGGAFGPHLLVRGLAPAIAGRMEDLRTTFLAALALGIVDQSVFYRFGNPAITNTILFVVILGSLLFQHRGVVSRAQELGASTWQAVKEVRPIPRELRSMREIKIVSVVAGGSMALLAILFGLFGPTNVLSSVTLILIYGMVGMSLVLLTGWAGQISLGQIGFFAIGAAVTATLSADRGWNLLLAMVVGGLLGGGAAIVIGLPALRVRGLFLAASTVAFALFIATMVLNPRYFRWLLPAGRYERPSLFGLEMESDRTFFFFVLVVLILMLASIRSLRRSRTGRVLIGARDNERAARAFGVSVTRARLTAFAFSGFYAAIAGGLYAVSQNSVIAQAFDVQKSMQVFVMVVIGGLGSLPGALLGAAYFFGTQFFLSGPLSLLASGLGMLVMLMILPGGLGQLFYGWRDSLLRGFARRKGVVVPSLVADVRVEESVLLPGAQPKTLAESPPVEVVEVATP